MIYHDISIVNGLHTQMITHVWGTTFHLGPHIQKSGGDLLELNARHLNLQESPIVGYWQQLETIVYNCTTICYNYKNLWTSNAKTTNTYCALYISRENNYGELTTCLKWLDELLPSAVHFNQSTELARIFSGESVAWPICDMERTWTRQKGWEACRVVPISALFFCPSWLILI